MRASASIFAALPMSAETSTTAGFLPPNSSVTGTRFLAASCATDDPTSGEPVKNRWSTASFAKSEPEPCLGVITASSSIEK
ncbi:Uncharacterised protein [Mycobacteroides abscessus subsp. abscessus]|nr:Uncharacterised protein [Mycobacteroides abscessus subsp. abscessus]